MLLLLVWIKFFFLIKDVKIWKWGENYCLGEKV